MYIINNENSGMYEHYMKQTHQKINRLCIPQGLEKGASWGWGRARFECGVAKNECEIFIQQNKHGLPSRHTVYKKKRGGVSHPKTACGTCRASQNCTQTHKQTITFIHIQETKYMIHTNTHMHIFTHNMHSKKNNVLTYSCFLSHQLINQVCNTHVVIYTQITWRLRGQSWLFVPIMFNYHQNVSLQWSLYISWYKTELTLIWTTHDFTQISISLSTQHTTANNSHLPEN
jgi:hypothetical protein